MKQSLRASSNSQLLHSYGILFSLQHISTHFWLEQCTWVCIPVIGKLLSSSLTPCRAELCASIWGVIRSEPCHSPTQYIYYNSSVSQHVCECNCTISWAKHKVTFLIDDAICNRHCHSVIANKAYFCFVTGVWLSRGAALGSSVPRSSNSCWALPVASQEPIRGQEKEWGGARAGMGNSVWIWIGSQIVEVLLSRLLHR